MNKSIAASAILSIFLRESGNGTSLKQQSSKRNKVPFGALAAHPLLLRGTPISAVKYIKEMLSHFPDPEKFTLNCPTQQVLNVVANK
ncbi:MAG: hypothetical protein ACFB16_11035 [Phormidesmis sp.]